MKSAFVATLAACLYQTNAFAIAPGAPIEVPAACKNLALMQAQLIDTGFSDGSGADGHAFNPPTLTLKTDNGLKIGKIEYLGGDFNEDAASGGKYACDADPNLCSNAADGGPGNDWARVTIKTGDATPMNIAQVVVSMGGRGGCTISSANYALE